MPLLLSSGLHAAAARTPGKLALRCNAATRSYAELAARVRQICGAARTAGIRPGDRPALLAPNCIEYPELVAGLADAGAIVATLNPRSTPAELAAACDDCGAEILFVHASLADRAAAAGFASVREIRVLGADFESWLAGAPEAPPVAQLSDRDPFALVYSSGTTGRPKGILLSHRSRTLTFHAMAMEYGCYGPDDAQLGISSLAYGGGFANLFATLYFGGTLELLSGFEPERVLRELASGAYTGVFMVPTHFQAIFRLPATLLERCRGGATRLRTIKSNAAALPPAVKERIIDYWGEGRLHESYGSTEGGVVTNLRPRHQRSHPRSVGPAFALNLVKLLDDSGREVAPGEIGELYSSSPYLFSGYWRNAGETAAAVRDGWVSAGDLARQDADGFFEIADRKKDMVVSGGINVYPREIEDVLHAHPAVHEVAVIGVPDEYFGEALRAYVVLRPGLNVDAAELELHCRAVLSGYKVPKRFEFLGALPRNASGKVLKRALKARAS